MGGLEVRGFLKLLLFTAVCSSSFAARSPIESHFHNFWDEDGGRRLEFDVPAKIRFKRDGRPYAEFELTLGTGEKVTHKIDLPMEEVRRAEGWLRYPNVTVSLPGQGRSAAFPLRPVVVRINDCLQVALEVMKIDPSPQPGLKRVLSAKRAVVGLSAISQYQAPEPLETPIVLQRYGVGSTDKSGPVLPVVIFGTRYVEGGDYALLAVEKRDLLDPAIKKARIYLLPPDFLRVLMSEEESEELLAKQADPINVRAYIKFRQEVLMPWTFGYFSFEKEDAPVLELDEDRLARRSWDLFAGLAKEPDAEDESDPAKSNRPCAKYLFDEAQLPPQQ